jgi:type IV pilus assembly protein PilB
MKVEPVLAARHRLIQVIDRYYNGGRQSDGVTGQVENLPPLGAKPKSEILLDGAMAETVPIITLVNRIIQEGVRQGASDIHFEPTDDAVEVKYRIDGLVRRVDDILLTLHTPLTIRLKILAGLDAGETNAPLEGRISTVVDERKIDLRLSIMPSHRGSRIVLRVLEGVKGIRTLDQAGFSKETLALYRHLAMRPYGMLLVTGPSGSGKTTTIYSTLIEIAHTSKNVLTCEDPVEFPIAGISQSQVDEAAGLTFPMQVEAMMRQDPDVLAIGEIRDPQTARSAVRASLTGHMVIATMRANDVTAAITRLSELGIDRYLLASSVTGITSQRLLRHLCQTCRKQLPIRQEEVEIFDQMGMIPPRQVCLPVGCDSCGMSGFQGRIAIQEILPISTDVAELITESAPAGRIKEAGMKAGYIPLQKRAMELVADGIVTFEDARRTVALDPDYGAFVAPRA